MVSGKIPFKELEKNSFKENLSLFNRAKDLKNRALKLMKQESESKNENIKSE